MTWPVKVALVPEVGARSPETMPPVRGESDQVDEGLPTKLPAASRVMA